VLDGDGRMLGVGRELAVGVRPVAEVLDDLEVARARCHSSGISAVEPQELIELWWSFILRRML